VADDVLDEVISVATAMRDYGVAISAKGIVDQSATAKERASRTR
jgi:N-methylhydantoinase B